MLLKNNINEIKSLIKPDSVLTTLEERYCYSTDASNNKSAGEIPDLVIFVETIEDVQNIVSYANKNNIPIVCRGAGTNMVGACVCNKAGIVLNFSKMNKILEINECNMTATVQPGVLLGELKKSVEKLGLFYPPDPSNYKVSTVGGSIAQSSGGAMAFKYGTTKDYVLSLKVVTADGSLIQLGANTTKDAVGYHLTQMFVGSEGTLGIVVEATLKLIPKPETKSLIIGYFNNIEHATKAVNKTIKQQVFPASIDFMDKNSIKTVEDFTHCGFNTNCECAILIDLDGYKTSINEQINRVKEAFKNEGAVDILSLEEDKAEFFWNARRASFAATSRLAPDVITDDIIVPRENLSNLIHKCNEIANKYKLTMCLVGHIGDGNLHPQIALNLDNEEEFRNCISAKSEIYSYIKELGGTISAEHGIGIEKLSYVKDIIDKGAYNYMKSIKKTFDPKNILNPGKIFEL